MSFMLSESSNLETSLSYIYRNRLVRVQYCDVCSYEIDTETCFVEIIDSIILPEVIYMYRAAEHSSPVH